MRFSTKILALGVLVLARFASGALIPSQSIEKRTVSERLLKQDWSMPLGPVTLAFPTNYSEVGFEHIAPARIRVEHRQAGVLILSSTRPHSSSSPMSACIGVAAGSALLLFAYGFIPLAQSQLLRVRALNLKQDLIV